MNNGILVNGIGPVNQYKGVDIINYLWKVTCFVSYKEKGRIFLTPLILVFGQGTLVACCHDSSPKIFVLFTTFRILFAQTK